MHILNCITTLNGALVWIRLERLGFQQKQESKLVWASLLSVHTAGGRGDLGTFTSRCTVVWPFLLMLLNVSAVTLIVSATVPYVIKSLMSKRAPNVRYPKRGHVFFWRTCSWWPGLVWVHRSTQKHRWVGAETKEQPDNDTKRRKWWEEVSANLWNTNKCVRALSWRCDHSSGPNCLCTRQFLAGLARYDLALFHWPLECSGWRIYFPTLFHLL